MMRRTTLAMRTMARAGSDSTIRHAAGRLSPEGGIAAHFHHFAEFTAVQILAVLPAAGVLWFSVKNSPQRLPAAKPVKAFLFAAAIAPFLVLAVACLLFGLRLRVNMYGSPLWIFSGIALLYFSGKKIDDRAAARFFRLFFPAYFLGLFIFAFQFAALPYLLHRAKRGHFPGEAVSRRIHEAWTHEQCTTLPAVAGDPWVAGNVSVWSRTNPDVYTDVGNEFLDMRAAKEKLRRTGAVIVWDAKKMGESYPERFREIFPEAEVRPFLEEPFLTAARVDAARIGWAVLPPTNTPQNTQKSVEA